MIHLIKDIEGRKIRIFYYQIDSKFLNKNKEFMRLLDEKIISVCKEDESAKNFPVLNFLIFGKTRLGILRTIITNSVLNIGDYYSLAFVRTDKDGQVIIGSEILKNNCTVYINSKLFTNTELFSRFNEKLGPILIDKQLEGALAHELMHLYHLQVSDFSKTSETSLKLNKSIENIRSINEILTILQLIREQLYLMLEKIIREGIAVFKQCQKTGHSDIGKLEYTKDYFLKQYNIAYQHIHEILPLLYRIFVEYNRYLENSSSSLDVVQKNYKKVDSLINYNSKPHITYKIGFHIIYTILYVNKDLDINILSKMNYIELIKLYEKSISYESKKPIISYTSRNGVFDYIGWLENINDMYNAVEKHKVTKKNKFLNWLSGN